MVNYVENDVAKREIIGFIGEEENPITKEMFIKIICVEYVAIKDNEGNVIATNPVVQIHREKIDNELKSAGYLLKHANDNMINCIKTTSTLFEKYTKNG